MSDEKLRSLESLTMAKEAIDEVLTQLDESGGEELTELWESRGDTEMHLDDLPSNARFRSLRQQYYLADGLLDLAGEVYKKLSKAVQKELETEQERVLPWPEEKISEIASDIHGWLQDAVGDVAGHNEETLMLNVGLDSKVMAKIDQAKKDGVTDVCGWYADELYNDTDTLCDLSGDRIHDLGKGNQQAMIAIATQLRNMGHNPLRLAMARLIERWEK